MTPNITDSTTSRNPYNQGMTSCILATITQVIKPHMYPYGQSLEQNKLPIVAENWEAFRSPLFPAIRNVMNKIGPSEY